MAGALIVTAELGHADFGALEGLRRKHYPAQRNHVPAHLTMFHALPPSAEREVRSRLAEAAKGAPPKANLLGLMDLDGGVAFRIGSEDLDRIRDELADALYGILGPQDRHGWHPHVTIQNKVAPKVARALIAALERDFTPRQLAIRSLALHRYLNGSWKRLADYSFR